MRKALPAICPAGADGGPTRLPSTNVPVGADTAETSGTRDRSAAYLSMSDALTPLVSGTTTVTAASELCDEVAPQLVADLMSGRRGSAARDRRGIPSARSGTARRAAAATPHPQGPSGIALCITQLAERYQYLCSTGTGCGSARPSMRRASRRTSSESRRSPSRTSAAGVTTIAAAAANVTVATPA